MKKFLCLILALLLLCPRAFAAGDLTFTFSKPEGKVGDTVTIVVASKGAPVACSYKLVMVYDTKVLKPIAVKNINSKGFFMHNLKATYEGKPAVNALTADAKKAFEGDCELFSVSFEILAEPEGSSTTIEIPYYECYDVDLKMLNADFDPCQIKVSKDGGKEPDEDSNPDAGNNTSTPDGEDGKDETPSDGNENNTDKEPDSSDQGNAPTGGNENNTNGAGGSAGNEPPAPDQGNGSANDEKPAPDQGNGSAGNGATAPNQGNGAGGNGNSTGDSPVSAPSGSDAGGGNSGGSNGSGKPVSGDWTIFEQTEEVTHSENGDIIVYKGEFVYDEEDNLTDINLYDEEGKPAGSVKVEKDESGTPQVVEQHLASDAPDRDFNHLTWIIPVAVVLVACAGFAVMIIKNKKKEEEIEE